MLLLTLLSAGPALGCSKASPSATTAPKHGLGSVMADVGRRFELAGRAASAGRFELAAYEADELGELFEWDVREAAMPKEGPVAHIPAMALAFAQTSASEMRRAAEAKDGTAFAMAFQRAAAACNACHQASGKGFIEVPSEPGRAVPVLDPSPSRAASAQPSQSSRPTTAGSSPGG
jgi:mono/diheme cytochrome c family protein